MPDPTSTVCPRCANAELEHVHSSPVPGVWDVLQCRRCLYMWRTSEPARRTRRDDYPEGFRLSGKDIADAGDVPTVPPLRRTN